MTSVFKKMIYFIPCLLLIIIFFLISYVNRGQYKYSYFYNMDNIDVVEIEEVVDDKKDEENLDNVSLSFVGFKNNVADLNKWFLPIVGNYTITTYYGGYHNGIDYYSYLGYGSDILSANNGEVSVAFSNCVAGDLWCNGGRGNYVVVNHNNFNYYTMYMHLANVYVNSGDVVLGGDVIGSMGNTGHVIPAPTVYNTYGGTHLHYEVYIGGPDRGGYTINPLNLY